MNPLSLNWRAIWTIVRKDLKVVRQSRSVMIPLILLPLILMVGLPTITILTMGSEAGLDDMMREMATFLANLPLSIADELNQYTTDSQRVIYLFIVYQFAPFFLILPLMVSSVIGADSFAGEKERKTLEALIYTPVTDGEMYLGKALAAWIPAVLVGLGSAVLYGLVANGLGAEIMGGVFFPNAMWIVLVLWVTPAAAGLGLAAIVLVSSRVRGFQEAYQLGGMVVLPVVALLIAQFAGLLYFSLELVFVLGLILWLIDAGLLWFGAKTFQRSELIAQL